jgi:hypothetical protein
MDKTLHGQIVARIKCCKESEGEAKEDTLPTYLLLTLTITLIRILTITLTLTVTITLTVTFTLTRTLTLTLTVTLTSTLTVAITFTFTLTVALTITFTVALTITHTLTRFATFYPCDYLSVQRFVRATFCPCVEFFATICPRRNVLRRFVRNDLSCANLSGHHIFLLMNILNFRWLLSYYVQ